MTRAALALSALILLPAARAAAEPGRRAALAALVAALPEKNPNEDPGYLELAGVTLADQLASCRWDGRQTASIERLIKVFDKYMKPDGGGKDALLKAIAQLPDFSEKDRDPEQERDYGRLALGIRLAPDMTRARLVAEACRPLLRMHFDGGASRARLAEAVERAKAALDAAEKPE
ncbi:MAG: hypothetical protein HY079_10700 [Elusimicrobia bacterium]|nr:hypothetical protein [Elusimicrobiota bacterium]